ncbi:uncharacterized protein LOC129731148 [Wyeomyia smithii]|uniref:uncharacterized protein LOC129731148 n=1 Tax=Wyeomyia smithii TaxID=174621 RepID=UPI002467CB8D|nr:uncharacterized protein LOC129731148 [Wyeomyia smithii]
MVICTFFLNNSCRFGSKCINDHIDLASVIKSEVDGTLKGNQWPLSCFGPFKGRTCVPNFIEDFSYEEIRMMYLKAKMQNNIAEHQMQLGRMITEAKQKMQWLATTNSSIMNILIELYNQQEDSSKPVIGQPPTGPVNNPFAAQMENSAPGSTASIFGGGSASGGFGTMNAAFGNSGTTAGNIFGTASNQIGSGILGGATNSTSVGGNMFVNPAQAAATVTSNVFALPNLGNKQTSSNVFGAPPVFGNTNVSLFPANQKSQDSYSDPGGSIFGGNSAASVPTGHLFTQQAQSVFGQTSNQNKNLFANASQTQHATGTLFAPTPINTNPFVNPTFGASQTSSQEHQNLFGSSFTQSPQQSVQTSMFSQPATQAPAGSMFVPTPQVAQPGQTGPFTAHQQSAFGSNATSINTPSTTTSTGLNTPSVTLYSRMEDLNKEQLDAFNATAFEIGKIPTVPPPRELCN